MRGKKAKTIRKRVYGTMSKRTRRYMKDENGTVINVGLRRSYQLAKEATNRV